MYTSKPIKPTEQQALLLKQGVDYLAEKQHRVLLIEGSAGTGKTTLIGFMIPVLQKALELATDRKYSAVMSAPTNKAVEVLKTQSSREEDIYSDYCTLHAALRLRYKIDETTGEEVFEPDNKARNRISGATLLVIDEASMVSNALLRYVDQAMTNNPLLKVIFLGDAKQLPPVNETVSPVFSKGFYRLALTEIIRQAAENPIITLSNNLQLLHSMEDCMVAGKGLGYSYTKNITQIIRYFSKHREDLGVRFLGYTNQCVDTFNSLVRKEIYYQPHKVELGETIIINRPYETEVKGEEHQHLYSNNEEVLIEQLEVVKMVIKCPVDKRKRREKIQLMVYLINEELPIVHEESEFQFADLLELLRRKAINRDYLWRDYYKVRDKMVDFKHRYALTVHKAQGSTYREVFMDFDDMRKNRGVTEYPKLLYTAITRASKHLTILTSQANDGR